MSSTNVFFVVLALALFAGVAVQAEVTECLDITKKNQCRKSDDKFAIGDCYWSPIDVECLELPTTCDGIYDKMYCNKAMTLLNTTEDNCVWDTEAGECFVPTECEDLGSRAKCNKFEMYPTVDVTGGACKYNNNEGCFLNLFPTSCEEISSAKQCKNSEKRFGFECLYVGKECIDPPTTCAEIPTRGLCSSANAKLGFPCYFQAGVCGDAPTTCEGLASRNKCLNAGADLGIAACDWNTDGEEAECTTITCEDITGRGACLAAEEKYMLNCYFDKPSKSCMTL